MPVTDTFELMSTFFLQILLHFPVSSVHSIYGFNWNVHYKYKGTLWQWKIYSMLLCALNCKKLQAAGGCQMSNCIF